ncbi:MAG: hypothetical protein CM1200mP6_02210 [Anaerolineaceae bacterium]|nr:MAG: hypothetical protein CM1200mP6_02210 [Anaerolineaceae bacterium]
MQLHLSGARTYTVRGWIPGGNFPDEDERAQAFQTLSGKSTYRPNGDTRGNRQLSRLFCSDEASFITGSAYDVDGGTILIR